MNPKSYLPLFFAASVALGTSACSNMEFTHVKPGQSARAALTARNAPPAAVPVNLNVEGGLPTPAEPTRPNGTQPPMPSLPPIDPLLALPDSGNGADRTAEFFVRGSAAMQAGQNAEAIAALEEAVALDPNFSDAWSKLVILYERTGQKAKSIAAYKKAKKLGQANGPTSGLPLPSGGLIP